MPVGAEEMGAAAVDAVVVGRVFGVQPLQCLRQSCVRDVDKRVVVVAHQNVGEELDSVFQNVNPRRVSLDGEPHEQRASVKA